MVNVDVHRSVQGTDQQGLVSSLSLVSSSDGLGLPVSPVDVLLKKSHSKDVGDVLSQNYKSRGHSNRLTEIVTNKLPPGNADTYMSIGSIQAGKSNVVFPGIGPVDAVINKIQSQTIGPSDLVFYNNTPVGAIHPNPSYMGGVSPV